MILDNIDYYTTTIIHQKYVYAEQLLFILNVFCR